VEVRVFSAAPSYEQFVFSISDLVSLEQALMHRLMYKNASKYIFKRGGIYYFIRRIPYDVRPFYESNRISKSLRTSSSVHAERLAKSLNHKLEDYWLGLRVQQIDVPKICLSNITDNSADNTCLLSEACELYIRLKSSGKDKVFVRTANRNTESVIRLLGNRPIGSYSSSDAAKFRDWLLDKGLSIKSVKRNFSSIRAIVNLSISELGLDCSNAFARTYFPEDNREKSRLPIPIENIRKIQQLCRDQDDDMRWLIALISDTGMRLGEAVGLHKDDFRINNDIPFIDLKPHPWRSLKTKGSQRHIPLVGASLWASKRVLEADCNSPYAFPRYFKNNLCNANSASNALNKWLHPHVPKGCVIHSFRHSLRDRLRAIECPSDIIDQIGGWKTAGVGQAYGNGFDLTITHKYLSKILDDSSDLY